MAEEKKLRYSRQREMIYDYLASTKSHPSAEMIYETLKQEDDSLSLGTVYRNLKLLESLGKVRRVANFNDHERYDANCLDHVHFLCSDCGKVLDVDEIDAVAIRKNLCFSKNYDVSSLSLTLTGVCPDCLNKKNR